MRFKGELAQLQSFQTKMRFINQIGLLMRKDPFNGSIL